VSITSGAPSIRMKMQLARIGLQVKQTITEKIRVQAGSAYFDHGCSLVGHMKIIMAAVQTPILKSISDRACK